MIDFRNHAVDAILKESGQRKIMASRTTARSRWHPQARSRRGPRISGQQGKDYGLTESPHYGDSGVAVSRDYCLGSGTQLVPDCAPGFALPFVVHVKERLVL